MLIALLFVACRTAAAMNWRLALVSVRSAWLITLEAAATRFALRLAMLNLRFFLWSVAGGFRIHRATIFFVRLEAARTTSI